eukprot:gene6677-1193_t
MPAKAKPRRASKEAAVAALGPPEPGPATDVYRRLADSGVFQRCPKPVRGDWLAEHQEPGQTVASFGRRAFKVAPHATYKTILLQPIGDFGQGCLSLDTLSLFVRAYYPACLVRVLPAVPVDEVAPPPTPPPGGTCPTMPVPGAQQRTHDGTEQLLIRPLMDFCMARLKQKDLARQALCTVAVTMMDLYPGEEWNFVFGQASLVDGVGVFSFARYVPSFYGQPLSPAAGTVALGRAAKECLKKLAGPHGWDILQRYQALYQQLIEMGMERDAQTVFQALIAVSQEHPE